eukprot:6427181-Prymnesium_polylepis.1
MTVRNNLRTHFHDPAWDCVVYSYVPFPTAAAGTSEPADAARAIKDRCRIVECLGCGEANAWNLTTPALLAPYEYLLLLAGDVELPRA